MFWNPKGSAETAPLHKIYAYHIYAVLEAYEASMPS